MRTITRSRVEIAALRSVILSGLPRYQNPPNASWLLPPRNANVGEWGGGGSEGFRIHDAHTPTVSSTTRLRLIHPS
jgi:hypothetical protein